MAETVACENPHSAEQIERNKSAAHRHAVALRQCSIFAADVGENIAKAMIDAADFLDACNGGGISKDIKEAALQSAADANGGYIDGRTVRVVKAALASIEASWGEPNPTRPALPVTKEKKMSETVKHTPGPWTVDGPPHNQIVWSSPENRVCFLAHSNGIDDERDIATGRLIAAAPDLLEALKLCVENIQGIADEEDIPSTAIRDFARAAIAKAEGRS